MYLQSHSVKQLSKNHDIRVLGLFGSLRGRVLFGSGSCTFLHVLPGSGSDSVLGTTWVLIRSFLLDSGSFPSLVALLLMLLLL